MTEETVEILDQHLYTSKRVMRELKILKAELSHRSLNKTIEYLLYEHNNIN